MSAGELKSGGLRIEINCPHVENGACPDCMWPQIMPFVGARQTLDELVPKMKLLADALREEAKRTATLAKGVDKMREWVEIAAAAKWHVADEPAPRTGGDAADERSDGR
jgi:hypothetical protein